MPAITGIRITAANVGRLTYMFQDRGERMQKSDEYSGNAVDVPDILSENLQKIDKVLAKQNTPIPDRPLAALHKLLIVGAIMEEDGTPVNSEPSQILDADWFPPIMKWITAWYRLQYGNAARFISKEPLTGFLLIRETPFLLHAPPQIVRAGSEKGTAWLHLVDRVLDDENALDWVHNLPATSDPSERQGWKADATAVAADLRFLQNRVVSLKPEGNEELLALARSIVPHLGQAAVMVTSHKPVEIIRSYWELQMAAEAGFKSLLLQQNGSYPHIHDLMKLAGDIASFDASFSSPSLNLFPHWKKAADMRYGTGDAPSWETCYRDYRCVFSIVRQCVSRWKRADLSDARFLLKKPSWT
jgi:hypothetical protein